MNERLRAGEPARPILGATGGSSASAPVVQPGTGGQAASDTLESAPETAMRAMLLLLTAVMLATVAGAQDGRVDALRDESGFLRKLVDLDGLPVLEPGARCAQSSSYDRHSKYDAATDQYIDWDANGDCGWYIRTEGDEAVMADITGPGVIWRIWSANPQSHLRIYLDGAAKPSYEWDFNDLFSGKIEPFRRPIVWQRGAGHAASDCYLPIPFAKSCKVTAVLMPDKAGKLVPPNQYYHVQYRTFAPETKVATFRLPFSEAETALLTQVCAALSKSGEDPQPAAGAKTETHDVDLAPGAEVTIAELAGPATVRGLKAKLEDAEPWGTRQVVLRAYWDDDPKPAVEAPFEAFFGEGFQGGIPNAPQRAYTALTVGTRDGWWYSFWRMPFAKHARFTAVNLGTQAAKLSCALTSTAGVPAGEWGQFHARFRREANCPEFEYAFLDATGRGTFVGVALFVDNSHGGWWGEGDEKAYVDGEKFPSTWGTGSEDYFGDAWGIQYFNNPYHGGSEIFGTKQSCRRFQLVENIPWTQHFRMTIENYSWPDTHETQKPSPFCKAKGDSSANRNDYSSTAYWYALPGGTDFFTPLTRDDVLPWGRTVVGATEAETLKVTASDGAKPQAVVNDLAYSKNGGWLLLAAKAGDSMELTGELARPGDWNLVVGHAAGPGLGRFKVSLDGNDLPVEVDGYAAEPGMAQTVLGEVHLGDDPSRLKITVSGKADAATGYAVGLDYFLLKPILIKGAIEGETMKVLEQVGCNTEVQELGERFSGGAQLWFPNHDKDSYFTVELPVKTAGKYELNCYFCTAGDYGICQVELDGKAIGTFDAYHDGIEPSGRRNFGVQDLTAGAHKLTLRAIDKNPKSTSYMIGLDCVQLVPRDPLVGQVFEGEAMKVLEQVGCDTGVQTLDDRFSGGAQLWFPNHDKGSYFSVELPVDAAGKYELNLILCTAIDYGICQVELDGKVLGKFDAFHDGVEPSKRNFGTLELTAGVHKLTLRAIDKNPDSTGYMIGLDCVQLKPAP
jgi:hypothetical protein